MSAEMNAVPPMTMPASAAALPAATPAKVPSAAYAKWLARQRREKTLVLASRLLLLAAFFGLWEILAKTKVVNPMLTSYPSALWPTFVDLLHNGNLLTHTWATFKATVVGFVLSMVFGIAIAAGLWWSRFANKVLDPFLVVANAMPKIAFVPIFYIWLGSEYSVYGMAVAIAIFVTIMVAYEGFQSTDPNKIKLATTLGASRAQVLRMVVLPGSVPTLIAALKMNIGLSLVGVIVGEFQSASEGLGFLIVNGSQVFKLNIVMTAIVVLALMSALMYLVIARVEHHLARRYG
ncbi:putative aliphatic sulfonates transport permease protein SsuC [Variovorax paradoxus]|uniref:Putative aliphatic sulfonates transport permease protein SsuC n=2 Tax=Variovorax paradoxus TaxID=34073 RepID=A0A0H2LV75_VARPD|nr:putative aliphatic sulfonates transport permease protein SsuC [Variovorax paradoxus]